MANTTNRASLEDLQLLYRKLIEQINPGKQLSGIKVQFYPYSGINHTIRIRENIVYVRLSDTFVDAPIEVHYALALILVSKLFKKKVPKNVRDNYSAFVSSVQFRDKAVSIRKVRGKKRGLLPQGECYDLENLFERVNSDYFSGSLEKPDLAWSSQKTYRRLGNYDFVHDTITISRSLDSTNVPSFVVEYVLYHEMLHKKHGVKEINGKRYFHTPAFRRDEQQFKQFSEAELWLDRNASSFKKDVKGGWRKYFF